MKIDEVMREALLKTDGTAKGKTDAAGSVALHTSALLGEQTLGADFVFPDLLQAFSRVVARRQQLMDNLPENVKEFVSNALRPDQESNPAGVDKPSIQQGISALVRDSRATVDTLRQVASELEFVDRVPALSVVFDSAAEQNNAEKTEKAPASDMVPGKNPENATRLISAGEGAKYPIAASAQKLQATIDAAIDQFLGDIRSANRTPGTTQTPAAALNALVAKAVASGTIGEELSRWITVADVVIGKLTESAEPAVSLAAMEKQIDPQIVKLAESAGKPELLRVLAVANELGQEPFMTEVTDDFVRTSPAPSSLLTKMMPQGDKEALQNLLQNLSAGAGSDTLGKNVGAFRSAVLSRAGQFEMILSSIGASSEDKIKLLNALPAVVSEMEKIIPAREQSKAAANVYDTLARSAPKWLRDLSEQTKTPELIEFWVCAKAADLSPWVHLSSAERQQSAAALKELASSFAQPGAFRAAADDGSTRGLTLQMALFAPGQEKPYPALIQVFEEKRERGPGQPPEQEIWVRVSLETDNIGPVDLSFRLQDKKYLSVFTRFAKPGTAAAFRECLSEIRGEFAGTSLQLKKIAVSERSSNAGGD